MARLKSFHLAASHTLIISLTQPFDPTLSLSFELSPHDPLLTSIFPIPPLLSLLTVTSREFVLHSLNFFFLSSSPSSSVASVLQTWSLLPNPPHAPQP